MVPWRSTCVPILFHEDRFTRVRDVIREAGSEPLLSAVTREILTRQGVAPVAAARVGGVPVVAR